MLANAVDVDPEILRFPGVPPMFALRDPDGNCLYVVQRMG
jgi:lactoylglutathione lyase